MKQKVLTTRREVMRAAASEFPGGQACAAAHLGIKPKRLQNQVYETAGCMPLSDTEIHALESLTGTTHLADYICGLYGGVFVPLPEADEDSVDMYVRTIKTQTARGKVDQLIQEALADGEIDAAEAAEILAVHSKHVAARHAEVNAVIALFSKGEQ